METRRHVWTLGVWVFVLIGTNGSVFRKPSIRTRWIQALDIQISPVILLPGDGGSRLQAKLDKPSVPHHYCLRKTDDFFDLWLNIELMLPYVLDCWVDNMRMVYDNVTKRTENAPGVQIRVAGFGTSESVEYLDASRTIVSKYFADIANMLVANGYKRDISLRGAPYDFRLSPNELPGYFNDLKKLVEDTYELNNQTAVTFIAHSMGNLFGLYLLQQQTPEWKTKYIRGFISLAAPWAGAVKAIKAFLTGDNLNIALISALRVRAEQRTNPSLTFIMPNLQSNVWNPKMPFVSTPTKNYTLNDMEALFLDIGYADGWEMYKRTANIISLKPPGVPMFCMYGVNVETSETMVYGSDNFPDKTQNVLTGDGDGTVNRESLEYCGRWNEESDQTATLFPFSGVTHRKILSDKSVLTLIAKLLSGHSN